ncbi:hypothetical protein N9026_01120 [bacterium]|nr:hypothetical protein [bacterium]
MAEQQEGLEVSLVQSLYNTEVSTSLHIPVVFSDSEKSSLREKNLNTFFKEYLLE